MNIADIQQLPYGAKYDMDVMIASVDVKQTKAGKDYLSITVQDMSGNIDIKLWDSFEAFRDGMKPGQIFNITGAVDKPYNGNNQIKMQSATIIASDASGYVGDKNFMPAYIISDDDITFIAKEIDMLESPYREICGKLMLDEETWKQFVVCPAAKKHHGNKLGGLLLHTIGVVKSVKSILRNYPALVGVVNESRLICCALLHDLMKIKDYVWTTAIDYNSETLCDHRYGILMELHKANEEMGNVLSYEEEQTMIYTLLSHHGTFAGGGVDIQPKSTEDWILHLADMIDSRAVSAIESGK